MEEILDETILEGIRDIGNYLRTDSDFLMGDIQMLAAIFMVIYFAIKTYGFMSGDEDWKIMPLLRPFAFALTIFFWSDFVHILETPFLVFEGKTQGKYTNSKKEINLLLEKKSKLITEYAQKLIEVEKDLETAEDDDDSTWYEELGVGIENIKNEMQSMYLVVLAKVKLMWQQFLLGIVTMLWRVGIYLIHFIQMFFMFILIVLGPLSFAISIIPAFRHSYIDWISRFISVALYSTIARIVLVANLGLIKYSLELEVTQLTKVMNNEEAFMAYATFQRTSEGTMMVVLLLGFLAMLCVPVVSTWIVRTSGVGQAVGAMARGAMTVVSMGAKAGK